MDITPQKKTSLLHCVQLKNPCRPTLEMPMAEFPLKSTILIWILNNCFAKRRRWQFMSMISMETQLSRGCKNLSGDNPQKLLC